MRGNGRVFQRGTIWWLAYYDNGREHRESSGSRDRKDAVRMLRQRLGEVAAGALHAPKRPRAIVVMRELFDLAEQHYRLGNRLSSTNRSCLKLLRRRFGRYTVQGCTGVAIGHFMADRLRSGRTPETVNRDMNVLRVAFRLGYQNDLLPKMPVIKKLPELTVRNEFFTRTEIDALLPCLPEYLRDLVLFGYLTGWRKGEITGLRWDNVDREGAVIRLEPAQNKGRTVRVLTLQGELADLMERRWQARQVGDTTAGRVFHRYGQPLGNLHPEWPRACREAGLGHRWFHSLRRSAARNMSLQGIPEKVIMSIMGHKTRGMFDRYNIVTEADQRSYAARLFRRKADNEPDSE